MILRVDDNNLSRSSEHSNIDRYHKLPCSPTFVFYDGDCATCHFIVKFLLKRRNNQRFRFVALQATAGTDLELKIREYLDLDLTSSLVVWKNGELWGQASAVFAIISELGWAWKGLLLFRLFPLVLLNALYNQYATRRYQIAGRARTPNICDVLSPSQRTLFPNEWPEVSLTFPPRREVFLSAQWRELILLNFEVPSLILQDYLPAGVEVDNWNGQTLVSLVGFSFAGTSILGMSLPWASDFEEVNLRFYVKRTVVENGISTQRRGVVFIREIVPFSSIATTANLFYGERYTRLPMKHETKISGQSKEVSYQWNDKGGVCAIRASFEGDPYPLEKGSLAEFITEHYYGYAKKSSLTSTEYEVEHPPWRVWPDSNIRVEGDYGRFYPEVFRPYLKKPHSMFIAEGSPIRVMRGNNLSVNK